MLDCFIEDFLNHILIEKGLSKNTFDSYKNDLEEFNFFLKSKKILSIDNIDKDLILNYYNLLERKKFSKSTLQRRYSSLNQFFKYLIKNKKIKENPMLSMHRQKKEIKLPKYLTESEIDKLLSVNNDFNNIKVLRNRLILEMLYSTGMRVSELCSLPLKSVIFNNKEDNNDYIFLTIKGKGQKERIVPIRKQILPILDEYISLTSKKNQKYLFQSSGKNSFITRRTIENIIKQSAIKANLNPEKISPHTMRHSFATNLLQKGLDIREIQELLGHSSIDTTSIYTKINFKKSKEVLEKFHPLSKK